MIVAAATDGHRFLVDTEPLDVEALLASASSPAWGAVASFLGSVRSPNHGATVHHIDYEGYRPMMLAEMRRLATEVGSRHELGRCVIAHRLGRLRPGDVSLLVAAASAHRADALEACNELVEGLKARLPVWKYEVGESGGAFVAGRVGAGPTL